MSGMYPLVGNFNRFLSGLDRVHSGIIIQAAVTLRNVCHKHVSHVYYKIW